MCSPITVITWSLTLSDCIVAKDYCVGRQTYRKSSPFPIAWWRTTEGAVRKFHYGEITTCTRAESWGWVRHPLETGAEAEHASGYFRKVLLGQV